LSKSEIELLFSRLAEKMPEPKGELEFVNPYTLLVAVVLSAQSTDAGVNKATRPLFAQVDTPEKMLAFGEARLVEAIRSLGFFNMKAKNIMGLSRMLVEVHGGEVPRDREALERLPGVGRKTANVVLNTAFGEPVIAVDTHIFRVANRTGLASGSTPDEVADILERVTPDRFKLHAHHWLILHGRYVCVARKPKCPICVIADICRYKDKTEPAGMYSGIRAGDERLTSSARARNRLRSPD
jgi:endonuclease-3